MAHDEEQGQALGLGQRLRRAREAMGRSSGDMAEELRLTEEQVLALEAEDYRRLPGEAYVRGYLRNYAAALGLPPEEIMAAYEQRPVGGGEAGDEGDAPLIPEPERPLIEHPWRVVWISLALLVVVSVFTVWLVGESQEPALPDGSGARSEQGGPQSAEGPGADELAPETSQAAPEAEQPATEAAAPGREEEQTAGNGEPASSAPAAGEESRAAAGATAPTVSAPPQAGGPASRSGEATLAGPGLDEPAVPELAAPSEPGSASLPQDLQTLRVHTWAKSWLEVADDRGRLLLRRLVPEGRDLRLYGQAPFQVKVGNAAGVQLYFEDRPLAPLGGPGQVVRLNVDADSRTIPESEVEPPAALAETRQAGDNAPAPATETAAGGEAPPKRPQGDPKTTQQPSAGEAPGDAGAVDNGPAAGGAADSP